MIGSEPAEPPPLLALAYVEVMRVLLQSKESAAPEQGEVEAPTVTSDPATSR